MKRLPPLSEMERIEQTQLVEKLDEILERIDNEDIGFVITENGLPDMVLIPFRWFAENFPDEVFYPQLGVKLCSMAGGGVSKNI